jgi:MFS family permease
MPASPFTPVRKVATMSDTTPYKSAVQRLSIGRMLSVAGGEVAFVALMALVFGRTHSAIWGSAALLAVMGTYGLAAPFAGMLGDRFDRRVVMIWSDSLGAVINLALVFVHAPAPLIGLAALGAVAQSPYLSASTAAIPNLVPADQLAWANATRSRASNVGFMVGPIAGGVLVASVGGSYAFAFNALALAASAALAWSVVGAFNERTGDKLRGGLGAGFRFLWNDHVLRWITGAWVLILCGVGALLVSEFPLAELFHSGSLGYGLLISSWGAGTLIGSVFAARAVKRSTYWSLVAGTVGLSVMLGSVAIAPFLWLVCVTQLIGGFFDTFVNVAEETVRQQRTPDELRSRVFAAGEAIVVVAMSLSIAVGGPLIEVAGPRAAYALTGALGLLAALTIWWGAWELHTRPAATQSAEADAPAAPGQQAPGGVLEAAEQYANI